MKTWVRDFLANSLQTWGVTNPGLRHADHLFIVTFHRVLPEQQRQLYPMPSLAVTPEELEWFLCFFKKNFQCLRLDNAWHEISNGQKSKLPRLAITFDDGQLDNYLHAAPVLDRHGVPATFFVPVDAVQNQELLWHDRIGYGIQRLAVEFPQSDLLFQFNQSISKLIQQPSIGVSQAKKWDQSRRDTWIRQAADMVPEFEPGWDGIMTWEQLRELKQRGHEIGCHSYTHPLLVQCDDVQLENEIINSKQILEKELGAYVYSFCYPNGDFDHRVLEVISRAGYTLAVTTQWGSNKLGSDAFTLKRHDMVVKNSHNRHGELSASRVAMRMTGFVQRVQ